MDFLIAFLAIVFVVILFLASAGTLLLLLTWFRVPEPTYKKSLLISGVTWVTASAVWLVEATVTNWLSIRNTSLATIVACIIIFHFLLKKYYRAYWIKTIAILVVQVISVILLSAVMVVSVRLFLFTPMYVSGGAMSPTYHDKDYLLINKLADDFTRSEIIVYKHENRFIIGRVIGLPGETIEIKEGNVSVNNQPLAEPYAQGAITEIIKVTVADKQYFVLPDNRVQGTVLSAFGLVPEIDIVGKVFYSVSLESK